MRFSSLLLVVVLALLSGVVDGQAPRPDDKPLDMKKSAQTVDGKPMYEWLKDLKEAKDTGVRVRAIHALEYYREEAREAVPYLLKALTDQSDTSLRVNAAIALGLIGLDAKYLQEGINTLARRLERSNEYQDIVRFQSARALGRLGPDAKPAIPYLVNSVKDKSSSEIRGAAAFALGSAAWDRNGPDPRAIHALLYALGDVCHDVRMEAIFSLIVLGPPLQGTDKAAERQRLESLTQDKSKVVKIWACVAIMRLDKVSPHYLQPISKYLKDPDARVRVNAARAFAIMGKDAKSGVKDLIDALNDKEPDVVVWVCIALGEMRDAANEALSKLEELTNHQDGRVKQAASEAIFKIKEKIRS